MLSSRRIARSPALQKTLGFIAAGYLRLVWRTNLLTIDPADAYDRIEPDQPVILALWHGQHFMAPFVRRKHRVKVLISRHRDGEINAYAAQRLGVIPLRGSGDHGGRFDLKGGVGAYQGMLDALREGYNMALTADVPKVARVAGMGIVMFGRDSGRPIYAAAIATSRRIVLDNWDRSAVNLPFGRIAMVAGEPVRVPMDADKAAMEECRATLQQRLQEATRRAYAIVDRKVPDADGA